MCMCDVLLLLFFSCAELEIHEAIHIFAGGLTSFYGDERYGKMCEGEDDRMGG